ncbi:uncharacterized protein LOC120525310 [Polypterus senegalus]|uniref:uncharacterized protein LOC120525310 n=1 Tax=Polypterus senegalus TaxID=55291 RepID=UPI001962ABF6|nr:uncharacterized protein LOC120525310 [Polypterus senegalus]
MRKTFQYRQQLVHNPEKMTSVLSVFLRFLDTKGLVNQDFSLLFGSDTSSKLLEKWDTCFKFKIIKEARSLTGQMADLNILLKCAESTFDFEDHESSGFIGWDADMASILLLVYLLPPPAGGKKVPKITSSGAVDHMVQFHKSCCSIDEHHSQNEGRQPYLLAVGTTKAKIHDFYIVLDKQLIPCQARSSLGAFDELFKAHFVFSISYDKALINVYTFLQTTVYNIDIGHVRESPRVKELRAKILNN